ncbi:MAG: hypothetical protein WC175_01110 [Candidatus Dojkabacteria bacterium]
MKNENDLIFADYIRLSNINPHNFALKNEYISNLITTCMNIIPVVNSIVGKECTRVTRGFLSRQYMLDNLDIPERMFDDLMKHSKGLALEMTFEPFDPDVSISVANAVIENDKQVKVIIDNKKRRISFFRESDFFGIYEKTNNGLRLVYVSPESL